MEAEYENGINVARPKGRLQWGNLLVLFVATEKGSFDFSKKTMPLLLPVYILHVLY